MKTIVFSMGFPGSGKSAYLHNYLTFKPSVIINPDSIRQELTGRMEDMSQDGRVWKLAYSRLKEALLSEDPKTEIIGLDATFLQRWARNELYRVIKETGVDYKIIAIETTLDIDQSLERMTSRMRQVFREVLERMASKRADITEEEKSQHPEFEHIKIDIDTPFFTEGNIAFVGDIHSCWDEFKKLLYKLGFWQENEEWVSSKAIKKIYFLGDYTDRGPESIKCIKAVMALCKAGYAEAVLGNHDDKLYRYLKGNNVRLTHGLELTVKHLEALSETEKLEIRNFLESLPSYIKIEEGTKKYIAAHAYWQNWMEKPTVNPKTVRELCMYGVVNNEAPPGANSRVPWWENPEYQSEDYVVVFGHYANKVDLPNAKCVDLGVCFGKEIGALVINQDKESWVTIKSNWDWNKKAEGVVYKVDNALTYKELFDRLSIDEKGIIEDIENDSLLNKRRYTIATDEGAFELSIANASKGLFQPEATSYAQQLAKGIVYDKEAGKIVAVTLPKIYNYGEKEAANLTLQKLMENGEYQFEFVEKMDGTQIFRFVYKGKVFWATRSVIISEPNPDIDSDFMSFVNDAVNANENDKLLLDPKQHSNETLIFELMHPLNTSIVCYEGTPKLVFLGNSSKREEKWLGQYSPYHINSNFEKPIQHSVNGTLEEASALLNSLDNDNLLSEGFVANILKEGKVIFRSKFKTPRFFEAMRLMTHCTYDRVVEVCTNHNLTTKEEFKSFLMGDKDAFPEELLKQYLSYYDEYEAYNNIAFKYELIARQVFSDKLKPMQDAGATRKDMALVALEYPFKGHLFSLLDGRSPDIHKELKYDLETAELKLQEATVSLVS